MQDDGKRKGIARVSGIRGIKMLSFLYV